MIILFAPSLIAFAVVLGIMLNDQFRSRNPVPMEQQIATAQAVMAAERGLGMDFDTLRAATRKAAIEMYGMKETPKQAADRMESAGV